MKLKFIS